MIRREKSVNRSIHLISAFPKCSKLKSEFLSWTHMCRRPSNVWERNKYLNPDAITDPKVFIRRRFYWMRDCWDISTLWLMNIHLYVLSSCGHDFPALHPIWTNIFSRWSTVSLAQLLWKIMSVLAWLKSEVAGSGSELFSLLTLACQYLYLLLS